jgi:D-arabinose 1-dehydrogenase-like Zn-dependent alcohol dehydrogenase
MSIYRIPNTQTAAIVRRLGGPIEFVRDYPVRTPSRDEVLAKVLYTGVCQSGSYLSMQHQYQSNLHMTSTNQPTDLHTAAGTASGPDGSPITAIKLPHIGGHEGVARIIALGPGLPQHDPAIRVGTLVGIRFSSRICRRCAACLAGREQYCSGDGVESLKPTNHLHHEDGAFQEYVCLDAGYLTILPQDVDPVLAAPTLCAGVTAYKAVMQAELKPGSWLVVLGAGGGLGHYAVQYGRLRTPFVVGVDTGSEKGELIRGFGAEFVDYKATPDLRAKIDELTDGKGADAVIVAAESSAAFATAASLLAVEGVLCCIGIPSGGGRLLTPVSEIVIKGLKIKGNLVGSLGECMEAMELVRRGKVKPKVVVREFEELPRVYEELERGDIAGRVALRIGDDPGEMVGLESKL